MGKHYVRTDKHNNIVKGFSSDFEQPQEGDVCINDNGGRHFELNGIVNPPMYTSNGLPKYKLENVQVVERTEEELVAELTGLPIPVDPVTDIKKQLDSANTKLANQDNRMKQMEEDSVAFMGFVMQMMGVE
jgi:hypothetical protein